MEERQWWVRRGAEIRGPFPEAQVKEWIRTGAVRESMSYSRDGTSWKPGFGVPELFPGVAPGQPGLRAAPRPGTRSGAARGHDPHVDSADRWFRLWARVAGIGLLLWIVTPILMPSFFGEGSQTLWIWDSLANAEFRVVLGSLVLPLELSIVCFLTARRGPVGGAVLFVCAAGTVVLMMALGAVRDVDLSSSNQARGVATAIFVWFALTAIAGGNHVRKRHPDSRGARLLTGIGGIVFVAALLIPWEGFVPIAHVFDRGLWRNWSVGIAVLGIVCYGFLGVAALVRTSDPALVCTTTSLLARGILLGFPALLLASMFTGGGTRLIGYAATRTVKTCGLLYGLLIPTAAGLAAWVGGRLDQSPVSSEELAEVFR